MPEKPLEEHLLNVAGQCREAVEHMNLNLSLLTQSQLGRLAFLVGILHDFGKGTTYFQEYIRTPGATGNQLTRHGLLSACVGYWAVEREFPASPWPYVVFQVIRRHHGNLEDFDMSGRGGLARDIKLVRKQLQNGLEHFYQPLVEIYSPHIDGFQELSRFDPMDLAEIMTDSDLWVKDWTGEESGDDGIEKFFIVNLLFSLLVDFDKRDAARLEHEYYADNLEEPVPDVFRYIEHLRAEDPEKFDPNRPINGLRDRFLREIDGNKGIGPDHPFYTLTAPTGIGKTFGGLVFARRLWERGGKRGRRIIYCLPYTSIIDQNYEIFREVNRFCRGDAFERRPGRYLLKHHHLAAKRVPKRIEAEEYRYKDYLDDVLAVESWQAAMVVTTFVQFFHTVIGYRNRLLKKFHHIVGSIVILDEVQAVDPRYYPLLRRVLDVLGRRFGVSFLLATATQPYILGTGAHAPRPVVEAGAYMTDPLFDRVRLTVDTECRTLEQFQEEFCRDFSGPNALLVMNTKAAATGLFRFIRERLTRYRLICLTTRLTPYHRRGRIREAREALAAGEPVIVVCTQLIEAGVDISFKYVYRDTGPMDSIIQVAGRCNRGGEYGFQGGRMRLLRLTRSTPGAKPFTSGVYQKVVMQWVEQCLRDRQYTSARFPGLAADYFSRIDFRGESEALLQAVRMLNYDCPGRDIVPIKEFKLIPESDTRELYVLVTAEAQKDMERLRRCLGILNLEELEPEKKSTLLLELELLKTGLKDYRLSLWENEWELLQGVIEEAEGYFPFIPYGVVKEGRVYDPGTGIEPRPEGGLNTPESAVYF